MTRDMRATLKRLSLSQTHGAKLVGVAGRTVRGWCDKPGTNGHRDVPEPVWRMFGLIENVPGVREWLEDNR